MSWLELSVRVARQHAALVETLLQNEPVLALTMTDDADDPVLEPGVGETPLWPSVCVTALFDGETKVEPLTRILSLVPGVDWPHQVNFRKLEDQLWERVWMDRFRPMQFGSGLWIVPGESEVPPGALHVLKLDPGLAFGTGTHPTTRLCLEWVDGHDFSGKTVVESTTIRRPCLPPVTMQKGTAYMTPSNAWRRSSSSRRQWTSCWRISSRGRSSNWRRVCARHSAAAAHWRCPGY